jgi:hypothetical protein
MKGLRQRLETMSEPTIKDEAKLRFSEPLLPIEKKLIGWSLGVGIVSLILLAALSRYLTEEPLNRQSAVPSVVGVKPESPPAPSSQVGPPAEARTPPVDAAAPSNQPTAAPAAEAPLTTPRTAEGGAKPAPTKGNHGNTPAKKAKPKAKPAE